MKKIILLSTFLVTSAVQAAGNGQHNMSNHIQSSTSASQEYLSGMQKMHDGMMKGAMAQDPEMRKLAQDIIKAQQPEIDQMQVWLKEKMKK